MLKYPHLFQPIQIGNMLVPNRICHVPTDVSSSNADGSVSERDIHHQMGQPLLQMDMPRPAARQRLRPLVPPPNEITLRTNHILCFFPLPSGFPSRSGGGNHFSHTLFSLLH